MICILPFIIVYIQVISAWKYSRLWEDYPSYILVYIGMHVASKTAQLNLASCSKAEYKAWSLEPILFFVVLYMDANKILESD
jgi:hypothetical protein